MSDFDERFWMMVKANGTCWEWTGKLDKHGYGVVMRGGKTVSTHRYSWTMIHGKIRKGKLVLHKCDNPPCIRPGHLFLGTYQDNSDDMIRKGRSYRQRAMSNQNNKLTESDVPVIISAWVGGDSQSCIARKYGVYPATINKVVNMISWKAINK